MKVDETSGNQYATEQAVRASEHTAAAADEAEAEQTGTKLISQTIARGIQHGGASLRVIMAQQTREPSKFPSKRRADRARQLGETRDGAGANDAETILRFGREGRSPMWNVLARALLGLVVIVETSRRRSLARILLLHGCIKSLVGWSMASSVGRGGGPFRTAATPHRTRALDYGCSLMEGEPHPSRDLLAACGVDIDAMGHAACKLRLLVH